MENKKDANKNENVLHSASLQTAKSVLAAHHLTEQELVRSKEELEMKTIELDYSLAILRASFESALNAIIVTDGRRKILFWNQKYADMFEVPPEIFEAGDNEKRREYISRHFKDPQAFLDQTREIVATVKPESFEVLELKDGRIIERFSKLLDVNNPVWGRVWTFHDITKRKQQEDKEREAKIFAEKRAKASEDFMALLSHEMRVPLTPVLMMATALREDKRLPRDIHEQLAVMERNIALEVRLIDDLNDITSISVKKLSLNTQKSDAHSLIELAVELVNFGAKSKGISIVRDFSARRNRIVVDPARFQQIIWNLLRNSIKFTPKDGQISIRTRDGEDNWLVIEVTDTGIGIEPESLEKIFLPLEQLPVVRERRFGGLGLGLAIARSIVELHGGKISARSEGTDRGATFIVELPGAEETSEKTTERSEISASSLPSDKPETPAHYKGKSLRLLLVDDHVNTILAISTLLTRDGHHVVTAGTIADALVAACANTFDLVISDIGLPDGSGSELMEKLRDGYGLRGIALSGYGAESDIARSLESGFAMHLIKPIHISELRRVIAEFGLSK